MTPCILWTKCTNADGYGIKRVGKRNALAHRLAYANAHGLDVFTMGGTILHSCDTPACVNPAHLSMGTMADNQKDMSDKGRSTQGERSGNALLNNEQVLWIRANYKFRHPEYSASAMAKKLGVSRKAVNHVVSNISWRNV